MVLLAVRSLKSQNGMSLVELMVSIVVALLLLGGILQILVNSTQSHRIQNALMRVQENGQFAMELMAKDIRNTDFWGCLTSLDDVNNLLNGSGGGYDMGLHGFIEGISGTANESGGGPVITGTDTITVRGSRSVANGLTIQAPFGPITSSPINVGPNSNIQTSDTVLVSDCLVGDFFQATDVDSAGNISHAAGVGTPGNSTPNLSKVYTGDAAVYLPYTHTYDIRVGSSGLPALFRTDENGSQEIVEGVENMLILYGEDTDNDGTANRYVRANSVTDMDNVVSIRLNVVLETLEDNLTPTPQSYIFNEQTIVPGDNRLRRVYSSTIVLRNRSG